MRVDREAEVIDALHYEIAGLQDEVTALRATLMQHDRDARIAASITVLLATITAYADKPHQAISELTETLRELARGKE